MFIIRLAIKLFLIFVTIITTLMVGVALTTVGVHPVLAFICPILALGLVLNGMRK